MSAINEMRRLAGLPPLAEQADTGLADITPSVHAEASPACTVPREIRTALNQAEKHELELGEQAREKGQQQEAYFRNTTATFFKELNTMLDGTTEGHKRAVQHMTSAMNAHVNLLPDSVVKFLSGNSQDWLNCEDINKEGILS